VTAWQNPTDDCAACGAGLLLYPEVTPDVRLIYVSYCPRCDAGEPEPVRWEHSSAVSAGPEIFWDRPAAPSEPVRRLAAVATHAARHGDDDAGGGLDLWWESGAKHARTMESRWAAFGPAEGSDDEDEFPLAAEGTFSFASPGKRKRRFGRNAKSA